MKLIILDRDGVINTDSDDFIKSPEEWHPIPGSLEAIAALKHAGWTVAVATNQSGIARGLFSIGTLDAIHQTMHHSLAEHKATIDQIVWCPHGPDDSCSCRKPKPGLYQQIAELLNCSLLNVPVVGDSLRDLEAAVDVGAQPILVKTGKGQRSLACGRLPAHTLIFNDLQSVASALLAGQLQVQGASRL